MAQLGQSITQPRTVPQSYSAKDLAEAVHLELLRRSASSPSLEVLIELFESMYIASLKTEESKPVTFHVVYLDPNNPDPRPPGVTVHNRWSCVTLGETVPLNGANFLKIAVASDPRTSSFAVHHDSNKGLVVWGLIDQGNSYHDFVNFDSETEPDRPGLFQSSITGTAHLVAYIGYQKVAELKQNSLVRSAVDVLQAGPIREALEPGIQSYFRAVQGRLPERFEGDPSDWGPLLVGDWLSVLKRLLLRVQNMRHGGAFLIAPDQLLDGLLVKHSIAYDRLASALERHAVAKEEHFAANDEISEEYMQKQVERMPLGLHLDEAVSGYYLDEIRSELDGAIWFTSLLTRVDGLVLLTPRLEVRGFGVEIRISDEPAEIFRAMDAHASESRLQKVDYQQYGTRHRSMMRYCAKFPGTVGFVLSQDGDVRITTRVGAKLVLWDNIQLQLPKFVRPRKRRRRRLRRARGPVLGV
jgi:hypothetical protein